MQELNDMKICQPDTYEIGYPTIAPDGIQHITVLNKEKYRIGYIHNKLHREDDSYYSPYLVYEIGKKIGIDVPETEVGLILHKNINQAYYRDSWFESSIIYDRQPYYSNMIRMYDNLEYRSFEAIEDEYFMTHSDEVKKRRTQIAGGKRGKKIEDYVDAYTWYLTSHGSKPAEEYTKQEIDAIKQELIDRALFSLRFDSWGDFDVCLTNYKNAELEPYYPSRRGMYLLNVRKEKVDEYLAESDEQFKETLDANYKPQYFTKTDELSPTVNDVVKHIFEKYPEFAEKSYKKMKKFTSKDMEELLETCTRMSDYHKRFALRAFDARGKEFDEIYEEHLKKQEPDR